MADERIIREFFSREVPEIKLPHIWAEINTNQVLQMYHFMCDLLFSIGDFSDVQLTRATIIVKLHKILCGLFGDILNGEGNFSYKDLILPQANRTRFYLVQLIKFYEFKCEHQPDIELVMSDLEDRRREVENENAFEENLLKQVNTERETLENIQAKRRELDDKTYTAEKDLKELREHNEKVKLDFEGKQLNADELQQRIESLQVEINEATDKLRRLENDIVSSPDRVLKQLDNNSDELEGIIVKKEELNKELRKLQRDSEDLAMSFQFLDRCRGELGDLLDAQRHVGDALRVVDDAQKSAKEAESRAREHAHAYADQRAGNAAQLRTLTDECKLAQQRVEVIRKEKEDMKIDTESLVKLKKESQNELYVVQDETKQCLMAVNKLAERYDSFLKKILDWTEKIEKKVGDEELTLCEVYKRARAAIAGDSNEN